MARAPTLNAAFSYEEMTRRNLGFVTAAEQAQLRQTPVFVCGTGGMGGAALQVLARAGCTRLTIADFDRFEVSNLNRQVFATTATVGEVKAEATARALREINPKIEVRVLGGEWPGLLDGVLATTKLVINGMDDAAAMIHLYRRAHAHGATVVDAYSAPLPSVFVVRPADPRPEDRLGFPTRGTPWDRITEAQIRACRQAEALHVLVHSSSAQHFDLAIAAEILAGRRPRASFAPVVIGAGTLMATEALRIAMGRPGGADHRGVFYNPWTMRVERPRHAVIAAPLRWIARRRLESLTGGG